VNLSKIVESRKSQATYPDAKTMLNNLLHDHEHVIRTLRADIDACTKYQDAGTTDFLTGLLEQHEKIAWMLRSFLENR
jgi:starvation-inducible DNA-binding protein